jgi:pimeloyl-ACP methyl ester carboxylesterase
MNDVEDVMQIAKNVMHAPSTRLVTEPATVICLHSSGSTGGQWTALRSQLETKFQVLTPDLHGHGVGPAWHGFDEDIVAADATHISRLAESVPGDIHLVGHSYGGAIALRVALYHPERVTSVAVYEPVVFRLLLDYLGRRRPASEVIDVAMAMRRYLRSGDAAAAASRFVDYWGSAGAWQRLSVGQQAVITQRTRVIAAQFTALANDAPRLADYRSLRVPVLMLAGSEMRAPIRRIRELFRFTLPKATFDTITAMGHMGPITHASTVAWHVARFVAKQASVVGPTERRLAA